MVLKYAMVARSSDCVLAEYSEAEAPFNLPSVRARPGAAAVRRDDAGAALLGAWRQIALVLLKRVDFHSPKRESVKQHDIGAIFHYEVCDGRAGGAHAGGSWLTARACDPQVADGLVFMVMADQEGESQRAWGYLKEVRQVFLQMYGDKARIANAFALNAGAACAPQRVGSHASDGAASSLGADRRLLPAADFRVVLKNRMASHNKEKNVLDTVRTQLDATKSKMVRRGCSSACLARPASRC
jgi:hypothetical protein